MRAVVAAVTSVLAAVETVAAEPAASTDRVWSLGVQVGVLDRPNGHLGIPLTGNGDRGFYLPLALTGRYQLDDRTAVSGGAGLPSSAMGPAVWAGFETFRRIGSACIATFEIYDAPGLQLGFAGPDYFARHDNEFVGYAYAFGGPLAVAVRLPIGFRVRWFQDRFDTFVEGANSLVLVPALENNFEIAVGARVHW